MNMKRKLILIYTILLLFGIGIISFTIFAQKNNIVIPDLFYIICVIIPANIGIIFAVNSLRKFYKRNREFLEQNLPMINNILCDTITIEDKSINIDKETGILFNGIFHHDYSNGAIFIGNKYRYFNIQLFNYADVNDRHSSHIKLFYGMMVQIQTNQNYQDEMYILKENFYEFNASTYFNKKRYIVKKVNNIIVASMSTNLIDNNNIVLIDNLLKDNIWAVYICNNSISIIVKSCYVYGLHYNLKSNDGIMQAQSSIKDDTYFIKYILDLFKEISI